MESNLRFRQRRNASVFVFSQQCRCNHAFARLSVPAKLTSHGVRFGCITGDIGGQLQVAFRL